MGDIKQWMMYDGYLGFYCILKFVITAITLSCTVPGGIFTPTFAIGAAFGQLYVSVLIKVLEFFGSKDYVMYRGVYSILGAAAVTGSVTRTISVAMIVLELNGHLSHAVPIMVCVLASYGTSEMIKTESFFEMLSDITGLDNKIAEKGRITMREVIEKVPHYREFDFLSLEDTSQEDLIAIVRDHGIKTSPYNDQHHRENQKDLEAIKEERARMRFIPVVDDKKRMNLMFMIRIEELQVYTKEFFGIFGGPGEQEKNERIELRLMKSSGDEGSTFMSRPLNLSFVNEQLLKSEYANLTVNAGELNLQSNPAKYILLSM
jgi:hypothetical protein